MSHRQTYSMTPNKTFYLSDFGMSKRENSKATPVGKVQYAAPEIFYTDSQTPKEMSLGLVLLEVLRLLPPCRTSNMLVNFQDWHDKVRLVASRQEPELVRMLNEDPADRFTASMCLNYISPPKVGDLSSKGKTRSVSRLLRVPCPRVWHLHFQVPRRWVR
jgi:serine/threonine protein kinase